MNFVLESAVIFFLFLQLSYSQIDEYRRQRNPFEFYQIGPEEFPREHHHHLHIEWLDGVPPIGTSDYVRYFARQTSGENLKHLRHVPERDYIRADTIVLIDSKDDKDLHSSHRNFVSAGLNKYYAVRTPAAHEPQAPIVGHYHSSYEDRNKGGKLYLGNRPFYF